jgi:hypothetical protein
MVLAKTGSKRTLTEEDKEESIEDLVRKLVRKIESKSGSGRPIVFHLGGCRRISLHTATMPPHRDLPPEPAREGNCGLGRGWLTE